MNKLLIITACCIILLSCKQENKEEQTIAASVINEKPFANANPTITIEESTAEEFNMGTPDALLNVFKDDHPKKGTVSAPPVIIHTQKEKLVFENIVPYIQKEYYDEDEISYAYFGYSKKINKHLLYAGYWENEAYFLIDHTTTRRDTLNGMPNFSPNLKKIISFYVSPYNDVGSILSAEVEIYNLTNNGLKALHKKTYDFIPYEVKWKGDSTILIKALSGNEFYETMTDTLNRSEKHFFYKKVTIK